MPKVEIDYSNTIIYKITCKDDNINDVYVGHTTNFVQRKHAHKISCTNIKSSNHTCRLYEVIRNNGGWDNWKMEIINFFNCKDHYEARKKEQEYFILLKATLNSIEPVRSLKPKQMTPTDEDKKEKKVIYCEICDMKFNTEKLLQHHASTKKHKNKINKINNKNLENDDKNDDKNVCACGKRFKYRQGLFVHKKKCSIYDKNDSDNGIILGNINKENIHHIDDTTDNELKLLVKELIKQNGELVKTINEIVPKIGNTTNNSTTTNFNLNVFLNEHCKDAINISDFIDSLKITLEDLQFSKTKGISRGITDVMIKGLKELDIHKRPIHCTDIKRDTMYIKDEDKWTKDENHDMIKNTIVKIADKERTALQQWALDNPHWMETERKQLDYLTMVRSICEPIENYNNYEKKILKNLGKEILIDKKI